jgi:hypothetical protein
MQAVLCLGAWSLMGFVKDQNIHDVMKLLAGPEDGGLEEDINLEEDNWEGIYDYESPIEIL